MSFVNYPQLTAPAPDTSGPTAPPPDADTASAVADNRLACAKCAESVAVDNSAYVVLACEHVAHVDCFVRQFAGKALPSRSLGGAPHCGQCISMHAHSGTASQFINASVIKTGLCNRFVAATGRPVVDQRTLERARPTNDTIDAILGRPSRNMFFKAHTDYESLLAMSEPELVDTLRKHGRTFDAVFDLDKTGLNIQDLYAFGLRQLDSLRQVGFEARHLRPAWRKVCPFWMMASLYNIDNSNLFDAFTPYDLLDNCVRHEELWLLGVSMPDLIRNGLKKRTLLKYPVGPDKLIKYLGLDAAHLHSLGVTRTDLQLSDKWRNAAASNDAVAALCANLG